MGLLTGLRGMNGGKKTAVLAGILLLGVTGCTVGRPAAGNGQREPDETARYEQAAEEAAEENTLSGLQVPEDVPEENIENADLVPEPFDFASILKKTEENGIEYYKVITEKDMPLPLNEWAKINIFTEQGNAVAAYVRFTQIIKDSTQVRKHVDNYIEAMEIQEPFGVPLTDKAQYVLLQYEIMIAGDIWIGEGDRIPSMALNYPLQLYSTLENGRFPVQGIERGVCDISIAERDSLNPGDIIQKEVICYIPAGYTAYGIELTCMTAQRTTDMVYFKPEYE